MSETKRTNINSIDFIQGIYEYGGNGKRDKNLIFERGVASFFDSGKDFGSGEARLRKIKAFFAKCLVNMQILRNFLTKKVNNASLQYSKSKQLFLGSCVYNHSVDSSCNGVKIIKNHNGKAVKVINNMLIHPSVWKHSYSKKFLKKITESIYTQKTGEINFMLTVLSENNRKQLANQAYQRQLILSNPKERRITGSNKVVVDIAPQISKKTIKYEDDQVYLSFSDITDQCRTGIVQINPVNITNIYYLKYDDLEGKTFMILMDIKRESPTEDTPNPELTVKFKKKEIGGENIESSEGDNEQRVESFSDFHNGVINIFTFINTIMSQSSKRTWCENIYAVLSNINPNLFENSDNLQGEIKAFMNGYNEAVGVLIRFLNLFRELQPYEHNDRLTNEEKKENGEFLIACLLKLKEMGDFLYIVEGANYMLNSQNDDSQNNDKSVTIITSDKGLVISKLLFPTQPNISLANYSFAPGGKQKLGIKLKKRHNRVSTLLRYDEQKGGSIRIDYKECIDDLINEIERDEIEDVPAGETKMNTIVGGNEQQYGLKFYNEYISLAETVQDEKRIEPFRLTNEEKGALSGILNQLYNIFNPEVDENDPSEPSEVSDDFYFSVPDELLERFDEKLAQLGENNMSDMGEIIANIYNDMLGEEAPAREMQDVATLERRARGVLGPVPTTPPPLPPQVERPQGERPEGERKKRNSNQAGNKPATDISPDGQGRTVSRQTQKLRSTAVARNIFPDEPPTAATKTLTAATKTGTGGNKRRPKKSRKKSKRKKKTRRKKR